MQNIGTNNFSLVLSGGGALGIAHLGVICDLESRNIQASELIGTSMGGVISACLSIGMRESEIFLLFKEFSSLVNWVSFSLSGNSIITSKKIEKIFEKIFKNRTMNETEIPLKIVTTTSTKGSLRVFTAKDKDVKIKDALLATIAIPGIFEEKNINGTLYSDGFLSQNLAVNEAEFPNIIAIDVLGKNSFKESMPKNFFKTKNVLEMFEKSMRILMLNQTKLLLEKCTKNVYLLEPITHEYKTFQFHKYKEIRELGKNILTF